MVSVFRSQEYSLHTTRSWEFAGVEKLLNEFNANDKDDLLVKAKFGRDVIVGMLDSGKFLNANLRSLKFFTG